MLYKIIPLLFFLSTHVQCSRVLDSQSQKGIYLEDYCPKMPYCPEGSHVMCVYYNPNSIMGPLCRNPKNVSMTSELANKVLEVINAARSKIARGKEKGKGDVPLPRGYGIFRLRWDPELATFGQLLANQCVLRHDMCRATEKFPEPGQTAGLVRFSVADWIPVSKGNNITAKGLNNEKLMYATLQSLKTWYGQKNFVTVQMLTAYTDWYTQATSQGGRLYMEMIYGPATHIGCGISAYTEYAYYTNGAPLNYNAIQIICNISARPRTGGAVYNTVPPSDIATSFNNCGCPVGSQEDDDCLCNPVAPESVEQRNELHKGQTCPNGNCDATVILLPIFTVEDAPPNKLFKPNKSDNTSHIDLTNAIDSFEELFDNNVSEYRRSIHDPKTSAYTRSTISKSNSQVKRSKSQAVNAVSVKKRHLNKKPNGLKHQENQEQDENRDKEDRHSHIQMQARKSSIFGKTPRFKLPGKTNSIMSSNKRDVIPRKDFSEGKKLADKFIFNQQSLILPRERKIITNSFEEVVSDLNDCHSLEAGRRINDLHSYLHPKSLKHKIIEEVHFRDILTTETVLNKAEQSIINEESHMKELNITHDNSRIDTATENDNKLLALLDTLEQEVKHIELQDNEKKIFDEKIKKIYGKVVGKSADTLRTTKYDANLGNELNKLAKQSGYLDNKHKKEHDNIFEDENDVHKLEPSYDAFTNNDGHLNYFRKSQNVENLDNDKYRHDFNDIEIGNYVKRSNSKNIKISKIESKPYMRQQNRNNKRLKYHNEINSLEYLKHKYDNEFKGRKTHKSNFDRNMLRNGKQHFKHRSNSLDYTVGGKNHYDDEPWHDDPLSFERKKYYQDKLDSMKLKLQDSQLYSRRKNRGGGPRHVRAMRPSVRSNSMMDPLYTQGRSRFLHGY